MSRLSNRGLGLFCSVVLMLFFVSSPVGSLAAEKAQKSTKTQLKTSSQVSSNAVKKEKEKAEALKKELNQKAIQAVADTYKALDLLNQNKPKEALKVLKGVIGELEIVLAANKDINLVPIKAYNVIVDSDLTPEMIEKVIKQVKDLINQGDIQQARTLLDTLQSEIDIVIENLPLGTYPDAIKLASKYIIDGKLDQAKSILSVALNSMVLKTIVIPLPLVRAADLVKEASKVAKTDKKQALDYLEEAKKQLQEARLLGYGKSDKKIYEDLKNRINAIEKEIKGPNKPEKMFEELIKKLKEFKKKLESKS